MNPQDQWSGEAKRPGTRDRYLTTEELDRRLVVVGRLVWDGESWYLESLEPKAATTTERREP